MASSWSQIAIISCKCLRLFPWFLRCPVLYIPHQDSAYVSCFFKLHIYLSLYIVCSERAKQILFICFSLNLTQILAWSKYSVVC